MKTGVSYSPMINTQYMFRSMEKIRAEDCSNVCAEESGCKRYTWQIGKKNKCFLFNSENLVMTHEQGSYSGIPRNRGSNCQNYFCFILPCL